MAAVNGQPVPAAPAPHSDADMQDSAADVSENTPLLSQSTDVPNDQSQPHRERSAESVLQTLGGPKSRRRRWPSLLALLTLCLVAIVIMVVAFVAPSVVEQYATQAAVFEPTSLSIADFTSTGVRVRIKGEFYLDPQRVQRKAVRDLGVFGTWIAREVESGPADVQVSVPEYGNVVLGVAHVPGIKVDVRRGRHTHVDFLADLEPGEKEGIRQIAKDFIDGRLGQLRLAGKANVPLKSGIFNLGSQTIQQEILFAGDDVPAMPEYSIERLIFQEKEMDGDKIVEADVSLRVANDYPFDFTIPPLEFKILVDNCLESDPFIGVARAITHQAHVLPKTDMILNVTGFVRDLPDQLIQACPHSKPSPLDVFVGKYMHGDSNNIYVRGSTSTSRHTPDWIGELISGITVPVAFKGRSFGHLIKNFTLAHTHFGLPDPFAEPDSPEGSPQISATVRAVVALPEEMNFNVAARRVRATADVFYKASKLGVLDLSKWQSANSSRIEFEGSPALLVSSQVDKAPLRITNDDLFTDVVQDLLFGRKSVLMQIKAEVDVEVETALGVFKIRHVPAEGEVPIKPISSHLDNPEDKLRPGVNDLRILTTTPSSLTLGANVNITNPTPYSASIPYLDIQFLKNSSLLGHATVQNFSVHQGRNTNLSIQAVFAPEDKEGRQVGRTLISQYLSGENVTISVRMHAGSLPSQPGLGRALERLEFAIPVPRLRPSRPGPPSDGDDGDGDSDDKPHFIRDATFHLFSSTAEFTLFSPLQHTTLVLEKINATAFYPRPRPSRSPWDDDSDDDGDDDGDGEIEEFPIATILYTHPFAVPPVDPATGEGRRTPRLPVDWDLGSVGYGAVRRALGGELKLSAFAEVRVRIGQWVEEVGIRVKGIGAKVRV